MDRIVLFVSRVFFVLTIVAGCSPSVPRKVVVIPTATANERQVSKAEVQGVPVVLGEPLKKPKIEDPVPGRKPASAQ